MKSKERNKKPHESIIGKIIYGFLLFMPLLAIGVTCAYAIFNKNAYQSYSSGNADKVVTIDQNNQNSIYVNGQRVTYTFTTHQTQFNSGVFGFDDISLDLNTILNTNNLTYVGFSLYATNNNINFRDNNGVSHILNENNRNFDTFSYQVNTTNGNELGIYNYGLAQVFTFIELKLDNVFYYSIDKVQQSPLFNWAEDSLIYTGMTNTCNALNITTPFIPLLMTYWLIISVIYILYDIILVILHIFHKKIHQLEDSF